MSIETSVTIGVYPDHSYNYDVYVGEEYSLIYKEDDIETRERKERATIGFGSIEEMEAVARAMLRAVQTSRA
jgi:ribosomal protein L11